MTTNPSARRMARGPSRSHGPPARPHSPSALRVAAAGVAQAPAVALSALDVVCEEHGDLVLVVLAGELDVYTAPGFQEDVRHCDPAEVQIVIDLAAVRFLDAAGLGALVSLRNEAGRQDATLGLVCPSRWLRRVFSIAGLRRAFAFGDDLAAVRVALSARRPTPVPSGCA